MGLDGHTEEVLTVEPIGERFRAFGWEVREVNGHDPTALLSCLLNLPDPGSGRPHLVVAHTVKGKGVEYMEMSRVRSPSFRPRDGPSGDHGDASTVESAWFRLNGALPGALVALRNGS